MNTGGLNLPWKRELKGIREHPRKFPFPRLPLPKVRKMHLHLAVSLGEVVLAETRSAKELFDLYFFPLCDVRTEYLTPTRLRPEWDEIGESQYISIEVEGKGVCATGARFYYRPHPSYRALREHITFDPLTIDGYYMDGYRIEIPLRFPPGLAPEGGSEGNLAA
jgi:uncharacterized protein (DUF427 family)